MVPSIYRLHSQKLWRAGFLMGPLLADQKYLADAALAEARERGVSRRPVV